MSKIVTNRTIEEITESNRIIDWCVEHAPKVPEDRLTIVVGEVRYIEGAAVSQRQTAVHQFSMPEVAAQLAAEPAIPGLPTELPVFYEGLKTLLYRLVASKTPAPAPEPEPEPEPQP